MLKVTNISNQNITIDGIVIKPLESVVFPVNIPESTRNRINALSNMKVISVAYVNNVDNTSTKKSGKKSNK